MSRYFSAMSKARLRFSNGLSWKKVELERSSHYYHSQFYFGELGVVQEVRTVTVDESAECQSWREKGIKTGGVTSGNSNSSKLTR